MENQEIDSSTIDIEMNENLNVISSDLKELIQYLKDENALQKENIAVEKQLQNEAELQQKEIDEQKEIQENAQSVIDRENEQLLIDSEIDFRTDLFDSLNLQSEKMDTYIEKSDGLLLSVDLMNANTESLIQNTTVEDTAEVDNMSYYADLTLVMITWVFLPSYIGYRMIKPLFNKIF